MWEARTGSGYQADLLASMTLKVAKVGTENLWRDYNIVDNLEQYVEE